MKKIFILFFLLSGLNLFGQEKNVEKPKYVIIANSQIISKEQVSEYGVKGLIKGMQKGVSDKMRDSLAQKFGKKIGDSQFIILINLYNKAEIDSLKNITNPHFKDSVPRTKKDEFKLHVNDSAKNFNVTMTNGKTIVLSKLKGKVVLLDFWTTWCASCIMELYDIHNQILMPFKNLNLIFLPISIGENKDVVQKKLMTLKEKGLILNSGLDTDKVIWDKYASGSIPKTIIIDKKGIIRFLSVGNSEKNMRNIKEIIRDLLKE